MDLTAIPNSRGMPQGYLEGPIREAEPILMDRENSLNVAVAEGAALPLKPMGSRVPLALLLAAFTGIAVGIGRAFGIEFFNSSFKSESQVEEQLGLPVLATIGHFRA